MESNQFAVNANLLKRSGAAILDIVLFTLLSLVLISSVVGPIYDNQFQTSSLSSEFISLQLDSGLYEEDPLTNQVILLSQDAIPDGLYTYYAEFKNGKMYQGETSPFVFSNAWYNENILKVFANDTFFTLINDDVNVRAVEIETLTDTELSALAAFYTLAYNNALTDLGLYEPYFTLAQQINAYFIEILSIAAGASLILLYLLVPLLFKQGRTLGKRLIGLTVVNKEGYEAKPWQLLVRFVVLALTFVLAIYTIFGSILISYTLMIFTKNYRSAHDFAAATRVIDFKASLLFKDENSMTSYATTLEN